MTVYKRIWLRRALPVVLGLLLGLCVLLAGAGYFLLYVSPVPQTSDYPLDLEQVRALARSGAGELPVALNAAVIAEGSYPQIVVVAGGSFSPQRMIMPVYQVVYPDGAILVDAALSEAAFRQAFGGQPFDAAQYADMQQALRSSKLILATHEHFDHLGGLAASPYLDEISPRVLLTREQIEHADPQVGFPPGALGRFKPLGYDRYYLAAPGVVLIKAPGHTPGSQMVYVALQNGTEFLLVGDVVWNGLNLDRLTGRSLLARLMLGEDETVVGAQIRRLAELEKSSPLKLVISHDAQRLEQLTAAGLVGIGLK